MATVDASIPLGIKTTSPVSSLSDMLGVARGVAGLKGQQISNQAAQGNLNDQTSVRDIVKNAPLDASGNVDQGALQQAVLKGGGLLGPGYATASAGADTANTNAQMAHFQLQGAQAKVGLETAQGLLGDPRIASGDPVKIADALNEAQDQMVAKGVPRSQASLLSAPFFAAAGHNPQALPQLLQNSIKAGLGAQGQLTANTPTPAFVPGQQGILPINTNANAGPIAQMGLTITPPNQLAPTTSGGTAIVNPATREASNFAPQPQGGPQMNLPAGETQQTQQTLQDQRTAALGVVNAAPALHDINRTVHELATNGTLTGKGAEFWRNVSSKLGYQAGSDEASNFNQLGKYLERSALTAAQGMGPSTNAGLEAQIKANGSTDYDPKTLAKIADLNESLLRGSEAYQGGLEKAIASSPNGVFAKRQFDQQWAQNYDQRTTAYMLAKERGDSAATNAIIQSLGGKGSPQALQFQQKLINLGKLTTQGSL